MTKSDIQFQKKGYVQLTCAFKEERDVVDDCSGLFYY